jgi:hypothetical protein
VSVRRRSSDAFVLIRKGEAEYHTMVEIDRGTMSIPRLGRKLSLYLAWAASGVWQERHPYLPALLVLTTTPRRVEQIVAKAEERCRTEARTTPTHPGLMRIQGLVVAATDAVERPEAAVADPAWTSRGRVEGLRLADLIRGPWDRWRAEMTERRADVERALQRRQDILADAEGLRRTVQALNMRWYGIDTYSEHLQDLDEVDRDALQLLLNETAPMTDLERRAWRFFARRTELDQLATPSATREQVPVSPEEQEAISSLQSAYLARQRETVASLHTRYPHLPWVLRASRELGAGELLYHRTWWERHERTKRDLAELKRLQGRILDYVGWRKHEVSNRQWGANWIERLGSRSDRRLARAIDEEKIRASFLRTAGRPLGPRSPLPGRLVRLLRDPRESPVDL